MMSFCGRSLSFPVKDEVQVPPAPQNGHFRLGHVLDPAEEPHHGRQTVQRLAVHRQDDVTVLEIELFDDAAFLDPADFETVDGFLPVLVLSIPGYRERRIQKIRKVFQIMFDQILRKINIDRIR